MSAPISSTGSPDHMFDPAAVRTPFPALDTEWALFDTYATAISLHESDLIWADEAGHRTPNFGELPGAEAEGATGPDPFGDDPFGADPFGSGEEAPTEGVEPTDDSTEE